MKTIFFDVDTQLDFLFPAGALFVPGAQHLLPALRTLTHFAAANKIQIISTQDTHAEDDPEFRTWKPHCVSGTAGQAKASATITSSAVVLTTAADAPIILAAAAPQVLVEKQTLEVFANPNLDLLLDAIHADRFVVYGVVTEYCVASAALGLLERGAQVELVKDAIQSLSKEDECDLISRFQHKGGALTSVSSVIASPQT